MTIFPFAHDRKYGLDDVDVREEVDLKDLVDQTSCPASLREFLYGADHSYMNDMSVSSGEAGQDRNLRSQHTIARRCAQTPPQPQQQLPGIGRPPYKTKLSAMRNTPR